MEYLILVYEKDSEIGMMEKMEVHRKGLLHRAFSIFIFNGKGELLLQQRALSKYHSGGLWANACCSHPKVGEEILSAANRRLKEEMGFETTLLKAFDFTYHSTFENGLTEYEFDHVYTGIYDGTFIPNKNEVMNFSFKPIGAIENLIKKNPENFASWFIIAFPKLKQWLENNWL